ncbi:putative metal-dependent hydrolase [Candidatus Methanoperedens nitroreducens]|uniref:Putative metal-dependent hydrolase n=1 Tax=Candidatus Methanoperedens nitratireducens TaxID=1392998 RepID=A0A062V0W9_9EURY|nr:SprT family zinc-dependent metalloprotease [Candidatus Methanoperedens nitroreducens]KCZ72791.1 putative metal-dependent hydrolase [Candidatus Methanoperedens nitroreducens]MCZ7622475.1 M48 family metallopeptidase [Candidatus Kuenenia sp.]MDJ1423280.1 SprT family zinc-dependent metalloprotease [Candidatus Methanoperedens sp.]
MHQIKVGNISIDVVRKDIKNLHLGVYPPNGRVRIAAPLKIDDEAVRLFAISKLSWIKKQQFKFENQERQSERRFVSGESHYYKGKRYLLNVIYCNAIPRVEIRKITHIDLYVREGSTKEQREKVLTEWYRRQLKAQIPALIDKWQKITGVNVSDWGIKRMKTKWGTCTIANRRIWLNLELAKKPEHCLEYIIVHEMIHLLERNHNDRFVAYMDKFMPQWHFYKEELNRSMLSHEIWSY